MMSAKQKMMTLLVGAGMETVVLWYWKKKGLKTDHLRLGSIRERFQRIYDEKHWSAGESPSGTGSTLDGTSSLRAVLPRLLEELGVKTLLDVGCGDFHWMRHVDFDGSYIGIDIVPSVIDANKAAYESDKRRFACIDAVSEPAPYADAALCREVLFHLAFADGKKLIRNLKQAGIRYILCTTDPGCDFNPDIPTGAWRELNLRLKPYGFPEPMRQIKDGQIDNPSRIVGLWELAKVPA